RPDTSLPKLSRKDKKNLKKKGKQSKQSAASKMEGAGPSAREETFSLTLEQHSTKGLNTLENAVDIKVENCSNEAASKTEGAGPSTCEDTFSLSLEQQSAKGQGALESAVDIKVENCSNELDKILREYSQTREDPVNESRNNSQSYWLMMEKIGKNKTKEGNAEIRQEFFVNSKESQKESGEMTSQSNAKELAEPAVETLAATTMKRQEATAVEEDAQRITGLEIDAKKEENLP
ncbi:hypothetical protein QYM36_000164, partial [Artemia franciscana]